MYAVFSKKGFFDVNYFVFQIFLFNFIFTYQANIEITFYCIFVFCNAAEYIGTAAIFFCMFYKVFFYCRKIIFFRLQSGGKYIKKYKMFPIEGENMVASAADSFYDIEFFQICECFVAGFRAVAGNAGYFPSGDTVGVVH